jgi:hypothetical protein
VGEFKVFEGRFEEEAVKTVGINIKPSLILV